jgi:hypothetical protein
VRRKHILYYKRGAKSRAKLRQAKEIPDKDGAF